MATHYLCRGDDHEDLTDKVRDAILQTQGFFELLPARKPRPWRVVVTCSHGHQNVYKGTGWSN